MNKPNYPYLGFKIVNEKLNVVFFTSEDTGVVLMDETGVEGLEFGTNGEFNEEEYSFLPDKDENGEEINIRIHN